jgi:hypothetical protein
VGTCCLNGYNSEHIALRHNRYVSRLLFVTGGVSIHGIAASV